jgi:hypothetical protein
LVGACEPYGHALREIAHGGQTQYFSASAHPRGAIRPDTERTMLRAIALRQVVVLAITYGMPDQRRPMMKTFLFSLAVLGVISNVAFACTGGAYETV